LIWILLRIDADCYLHYSGQMKARTEVVDYWVAVFEAAL
jgi:hypothetical protein